jgi:hypothetical protein
MMMMEDKTHGLFLLQAWQVRLLLLWEMMV